MRQPIPFGKYLLLDRISVGGMAEVFKAKSYGVEGFEKVIAIKRILPSMGEDRDFIKMFIDEAKIVGQLAHANICQIFELGRTDGAHFIAMEYIWGKDLLQIQNRLRKLKQQMPVAMAAFLIAKVCEGLDYAHKKRDALGRPLEIVHRDCSPQNILVSYEGEVKIIDFGIAKAASRSSKTQAGVLKGKFGYMSPEQVRGLPLDRRSDLFSIGTILYECLTGDRLFVGETDFSTLEKVRNVDVPPPRSINPNIPEVVERIIMKALARDADDRYQWCSEVVADLQRYLMSQDQVFTAKSLATWIKEAFAADLEKERQQLEAFKKVGREGLIAGVPQAEAKLDVVEHLGQAGQAEDPTVLGGPSFDDIIAEAAAAGAVAATPGAAAATNHGDEFVEEGPTEIFGEISEVAAVPANAPAAGTPAVVVAPSVRRPTNHPPLQGSGPVPAVPAAAARPGVASPDDATISPLGMPGLAIPPIPSAQQQRAAMQAAAAQAPANSQAKTLLGMSAPVLPLQPPPTGAGPVVDPAVALAGMSPGQLHGPASQAGIPVQGFPPPDQFPHGSHPPQVGPGGFAHPSGPYQGLPAYGTGPYPGQPYPVPGGQPYPAPGGQPYPTGPHAYPQYPGPMAGYGGPQGAAPVDMTQRRRKKPSLAKDIGIGVGIAVLVLGVFAVVKFVVLADGDKPVAAAAVPTAAVAPELVAIDAAPAAMVQPDAPPATALVVDGGTELAAGDGDGGVAIASADADAGTVMAAAPDGGQAAVAAVDAGVAAVVPVDAAPAVKVADAEPKADSRDERRKVDSRRDERRTVDKIDLDGVVKPKTDPKTDAKTDGKTDPKTDPTRTKPDPKLDVKPDPKADPKVDASVGYLTAYATPFAQVAIDGKPTGKTTPITPMGKIALTPGVHKVTFSVGREKFTYTVKIEAGKTAKITKDLPVTASSDDGN